MTSLRSLLPPKGSCGQSHSEPVLIDVKNDSGSSDNASSLGNPIMLAFNKKRSSQARSEKKKENSSIGIKDHKRRRTTKTGGGIGSSRSTSSSSSERNNGTSSERNNGSIFGKCPICEGQFLITDLEAHANTHFDN
jgi:hypothetical protein